MNNEQSTKKRAWVKNAAIIFLAVMLVLTFFSNTILNYSLPEVAGQYAGYGSIASSIRGTGTVTANMAYNISIDSSRQIKTVLVKVGDKVEAGQALFLLENTESAELKAAQDALEAAQDAYNTALITAIPEDYASNRNITELKEKLLAAQKVLNNVNAYQSTYEAAKQSRKDAENAKNALEKRITALSEEISYIDAISSASIPELLTCSANLKNALSALQAAQDWYDQVSSLTGGDASAALDSLNAQRKDIEDALQNLRYTLEDDKALAEEGLTANVDDPDAVEEITDDINQLNGALNQIEHDTLRSGVLASRIDFIKSLDELKTYCGMTEQVRALEKALVSLERAYATLDELQKAYDDAASVAPALKDAEYMLESARITFESAKRSETASLNDQLASLNSQKDAAVETYELSLAAEQEAQQNAGTTPDEAEANVKACQRDLEFALLQLSSNNDLDSITLKGLQDAIDDAKKEVERLGGKDAGSEIITKYAGTVTTINCMAGDTTVAGEPVAAVDVEGKGYTLSIPVTVEQSRQVNAGDKATVNNWWGNIEVVLTAIKADRSNPGQNKILEFSVTGDVTDGQSLDISVGDRQKDFDCVVPNSAIREDSNGSYILVATAKSAPLSTRYIATRVDVTVLAKDTTNSAISTDQTYFYEYVITTSSKPVEPGTQVRLVES